VALIRVFVDSNELFPFSVMDLILTLAEISCSSLFGPKN
jgi:hypothetical protein